jgi:hypothetical protein
MVAVVVPLLHTRQRCKQLGADGGMPTWVRVRVRVRFRVKVRVRVRDKVRDRFRDRVRVRVRVSWGRTVGCHTNARVVVG